MRAKSVVSVATVACGFFFCSVRSFAAATTVAPAAAKAVAPAAAKAVVPVAEIGTAVRAAAASPSFGGGLALPCMTLSPLLFEQGWTSHGSTGGMVPDADGWRAFEMHAGKPADAPKINGRVRFSEPGDGTVRGEWRTIPEKDAPLLELCVASNFSLEEFAGGTAVVDGRSVAIPSEFGNAHFYRGPASELVLRNRLGAERLRIAFDSPTRILLQDNRSWGGTSFTLRLFFAEGPVSAGREYALDAVFSSPSDGLLALNDGRDVKIEAGADWIPLAGEPWIEPGSALDFTQVVPHHAPAGKFGRVVAVGDHFELEGRPGVEQRFYGVNICGDANTPSTPEAAERFAANLARIGYNSLRIHHHERSILGGKGPADGAGPGFDDTVPDAAAMDRFDALVAACARHGIYVTTDLFVSRSHFTTWRSLGIDRDGCLPGTDVFKILCAFWEPAYSNLCAWTRNFLGHVNPYTGRSLAEEPALCALALVNEGNLGNWGVDRLRDLPGVREAWERWLAERRSGGGSAGDFDWNEIPDSFPDDVYADDGATPGRRHAAAFAIFLADTETRLAGRLGAFLRDEMHCQAPVSSLSCWYNPVQYQLPRTGFDYVDDHFYVDHPSFLGQPWRLPSRCPNVNPMKGSGAGVRSVVFRRLAGKPFTITEWNYSGPGRYRGVGGIATGVMGALQNWSGLWRFAWTHGRAGAEKPETKTMGYFDMSGDPLGLAAERAVLCLFLRRDLAPLETAYPTVFSERDLRNPRNGAPKCQSWNWLAAAWKARISVDVDSSPDAPVSADGTAYAPLFRSAGRVQAELDALGATAPGDGAVSIDKDTGTFLIETARTAGGFAESGSHAAGPLSFSLLAGDPSGGQDASAGAPVPATIWVSALDDKPIGDSSRILLTHLTDVQNSGIKYADSDLTILLDWGKLPHLMRRGAAAIELRLSGGAPSRPSSFEVYRLSPGGRRLGKVDSAFDGGVLRFTARTDLDPSAATFLYEIVRVPGTEDSVPAERSGGMDDAATLEATPVWGSSLSFSPPVDLLFRLGAYTQEWKFRGASGGARADGGDSSSRSFAIDMSGNSGDNVAAGALRFDGRASFRAAPDGALDAKWTMTPDRDGDLPEAMLETRIAIGRVAGGFLVDGEPLRVPESLAGKPHLFRGEVSRLEALGPDGAPWMEISFPEKQRILVQDNRSWGSSVVTLRLFLAVDSVRAGAEYPLHAVFRFPGRRIALDETGLVVMEAGPDWIPFVPAAPGRDWIEPGSALDLSATLPRHEPAGAFGRVVAVGDRFELEGRPGEEIRFCGVNIVHGANTPSVESADRIAANLARMGFNSVRIHHHERPILAKGDPAALTVDPEALDRLDALSAACLRHGLYITTDLYVSRAPIAWRAVGIDRPGDMSKEDFKMAVLFHEGAYSNFLAWSRTFMLHVNPYTGRCLAREPGLATLALVNEGNVGNNGRDSLLAIPGVAEAWNAWCADHPGQAARMKSPFRLRGGKTTPDSLLSRLGADLYEVKGGGKALSEAFALFLSDMEARFFRRVSAFLRGELGCVAPLSNVSSWYNPDSYALLRSEFDYDDDHGYVDHPFFLGRRWRLPSSHPGANPLLGGDAVPGFAWRRLFGKPFCVSEWNWSAPGQFRQASGLVMGALAARQGWSGMWRFAWSHERPGAENPGSVRMRYFDLSADPAQCASERATICLFLRGDLAPLPAASSAPIVLDEAALRAGTGAARRMAIPDNAPSGWEKRIGMALSGSGAADSGSREIRGAADSAAPDPARGAFAVESPRTSGGFVPDGPLSAGPVSFSVEDAPAAVWASSVDGLPLRDSARILVSHVTDAKNTGARFDDAGCRVWLDYGTTPALVRRGLARVELSLDPAAGRAPTVFRLSSTGRRLAEIPSEYDGACGKLVFAARTDYDPAAATLYYEIVR